ncbi:hypothetical protein [Zhongshania sp.]|nr:hypothetical protein [Zhongshania sp.]
MFIKGRTENLCLDHLQCSLSGKTCAENHRIAAVDLAAVVK